MRRAQPLTQQYAAPCVPMRIAGNIFWQGVVKDQGFSPQPRPHLFLPWASFRDTKTSHELHTHTKALAKARATF